MINVLRIKFLLLKRKPSALIAITIIICLYAYLIGNGQQTKQPIAIHSTLSEEMTKRVLTELESAGNYEFTIYSEDKATELVETGRVDVAILLQEAGYKLLVAVDFMDSKFAQHELDRVYRQVVQNDAMIKAFPTDLQDEVTSAIAVAKTAPSFDIQYTNFANEKGFKFDSGLHTLFGFALFMVIYTVANGVNHIVMERRNGIWNRLTVSRISKWEVYTANLAYAFLLGYLQIVLVFCIFYFGVGVEFYGGFVASLIAVIPYLLCIVALSIFIASVTNTPSKFNTAMAFIAVPFAMLGGAYWPLEIVTSKVILALSYISPITYGLEILKGVTINASSYVELLQPLSLLLFMTVVFMGIGISVLERKG